MGVIEDIIAFDNSRGAQDLLGASHPEICQDAASFLLQTNKRISILTGFPVRGVPETDGPPGAIALADALTQLGKSVELISWMQAVEIFSAAAERKYYRALETYAAYELGANALVTIEICGRAKDGRYRNFRREDITDCVPKFESIFGTHADISVGDGGNEFGMGNAPEAFFEKWGVVPPESTSLFLVPAVTSNFGCYGLVRALECVSGVHVMPDLKAHKELIESLVAHGCVDGISGLNVPKVDGAEMAVTLQILEALSGVSLDYIPPILQNPRPE